MLRSNWFRTNLPRIAALTAVAALGSANAVQASSAASTAHNPRHAASMVRKPEAIKPAAGMNFRIIDNPLGPSFNQLLGIDDKGTISGYYGSGVADAPNQGYRI